MDTALANRLFELQERIIDGFDADNWEELGLLTGETELIKQHPRLLRSLLWGDEDYKGNVLTLLRLMVERNPNTLRKALVECPTGAQRQARKRKQNIWINRLFGTTQNPTTT